LPLSKPAGAPPLKYALTSAKLYVGKSPSRLSEGAGDCETAVTAGDGAGDGFGEGFADGLGGVHEAGAGALVVEVLEVAGLVGVQLAVVLGTVGVVVATGVGAAGFGGVHVGRGGAVKVTAAGALNVAELLQVRGAVALVVVVAAGVLVVATGVGAGAAAGAGAGV